MEIAQALEIVRANPTGVLATLRADGRPHQSVVAAAVVGGELWFSLTQDRVKTRNIKNDARVSFLAGLGPWAALDGTGRLDEGDGMLDRLRTYYRTLRGEHPDWEEYDAAMAADRRVLLMLAPERATGVGP